MDSGNFFLNKLLPMIARFCRLHTDSIFNGFTANLLQSKVER